MIPAKYACPQAVLYVCVFKIKTLDLLYFRRFYLQISFISCKYAKDGLSHRKRPSFKRQKGYVLKT